MLNVMSKASILLTVTALGAAALFAQDADLAQYQTWMKSAAGAHNALRAAITAKDPAAAKAEAAKEAEAFDSIAKFWAGKQKADAQKLAETARDAAKEVADATSPEGMSAGLQKVQGTCMGCHSQYRAGSNFKGL